MRVPIFCNDCRYLFHLPVSNLRFLSVCPNCYGPREHMIYPARGPEYSPRNAKSAGANAGRHEKTTWPWRAAQRG
ncbi:MAG: hypothetical protein IT462_00240 [Planctomycetes bacterium]|nr:hypothetical protein [Planctomycetota bacterium]